MAVHKYTSWGRTRRPKNIAGIDGTTIAFSLSRTGLQASGATSNGCYKTENQRFLHIACSGSSTVSKVYGFLYATQCWTEIMLVDPTDSTNRDSVVVGNDQLVIVEISGVDAVAVSGTGSVYLAASTF